MSESQEEFMEEILKYEVENPLVYKEFEYNKSQWDNIPGIIPRFVLFLSKHLEALTDKCNERFTQISTVELEEKVDSKLFDLQEKFESLGNRLDTFIEENSATLEKMTSKLEQIDKDNHDFMAKQEKECSTNMKELISTPKVEDFVKQFEEDEELAEKEENDLSANTNKDTEEDPNELGIILKEKEWFKQKPENFEEFDKPRSFTLNQIKDLVYLHLSRSDFKKRFVSQNNLLQLHQDNFDEISQYRNQLSVDLKSEFSNCEAQISSNSKDLLKYVGEADKTHKEMQERIVSNFKKCMSLQDTVAELKKSSDSHSNKMDKMSIKISSISTNFNSKMQDIETNYEKTDKVKARIRDAINFERDSINGQLDKTKTLCKELIEINKEQIDSLLQTETENLKESNETIKTDIEKSMEDVLNKNKTQILKIKDVCTKYFDKNDDAMKTIQAKVKVVDSAFDDFMNNVVKPQKFGEARLFTVETRLKEEEDLRILEISHCKDIIKKLIFAIEQNSLTSKDSFSVGAESSHQLPNLLKNSTISGSKIKLKNDKDERINLNTIQTKGLDILFMKRLMYLKSSIDDDKHISKDQRQMSDHQFEKDPGIQYPNTTSSALISLK